MDENREYVGGFALFYVFYLALALISAAPFLWADKAPVFVIVSFAFGAVLLSTIPAAASLILVLLIRGICETFWHLWRARKKRRERNRIEQQISREKRVWREVSSCVIPTRLYWTPGDTRTHGGGVLGACESGPEGGTDHPEGKSDS